MKEEKKLLLRVYLKRRFFGIIWNLYSFYDKIAYKLKLFPNSKLGKKLAIWLIFKDVEGWVRK